MWWLLLILFLLALGFCIPRLRLNYVLKRAFPLNYSRILRKNLPEYSKMPTDLQMQLKRNVKRFLFEKKFVGCAGLMVTDEMRVTIAGKACLLLLNKTTHVYPRLTHVLVYPGVFSVPRVHSEGGIVSERQQVLSGESWQDGRVILAWDQVMQSFRHADPDHRHGHDVVLHEFAHQLDSETGVTNGTPALGAADMYARWADVMQAEFDQLRRLTAEQMVGVIDPYGATNPAEFFAVTTESFFCQTGLLAEAHPTLFSVLKSYYRVDPRDWQ